MTCKGSLAVFYKTNNPDGLITFLIIVELSLKCDKDGSTKKGVCECLDNNI